MVDPHQDRRGGRGLIPIGLDSDGGGRIRVPASMCGVVSTTLCTNLSTRPFAAERLRLGRHPTGRYDTFGPKVRRATSSPIHVEIDVP